MDGKVEWAKAEIQEAYLEHVEMLKAVKIGCPTVTKALKKRSGASSTLEIL
jgi:hypothetical protein